jgi:hypothetical protein
VGVNLGASHEMGERMGLNIRNKHKINIQLIDKQILNLCLALNLISGIRTLSSCCGHGIGRINIFFKAENLKALYWISSMCDINQWEIDVLCHGFHTCKTKEGIFSFSSVDKGEMAYKAANEIVDSILKSVGEERMIERIERKIKYKE